MAAPRNELGVLCAAIQPKIGAGILARVNITHALALGVACVGIANPCLAESFNCQYAKNPDEVIICQTPKLAENGHQNVQAVFWLSPAHFWTRSSSVGRRSIGLASTSNVLR